MFCDANHISISACLPLFIEVCESVQRALVAIDMIAQEADATVVSDAARVTITKAFYLSKTGGFACWAAARGSGTHATRTSCTIFASHHASVQGRVCSRMALNVGLNVGLNVALNVALKMGLNWRENRQLLPPFSSSVTRFLLRFVSTSTPG